MKWLTRFWDRALLEGDVLDRVEHKGQIIFACHGGEMIDFRNEDPGKNRGDIHVTSHVMC